MSRNKNKDTAEMLTVIKQHTPHSVKIAVLLLYLKEGKHHSEVLKFFASYGWDTAFKLQRLNITNWDALIKH